MKVLNEAGKKMRQLAMMNLNVGSKTEKEAAKRFLKDIGLSDDAIENIENKGKKKEKVEESLNEECDCQKCSDEKHSKCNKPSKKCRKNELKEEKSQCECGGTEFNKTLNYTDKKGNKYESDKPFKVCKKCGSPDKYFDDNFKKTLKEEDNQSKINSVESAQNMLRAKKILFNKTEKIGDNTVFKQGDTIVGTWNPAWGVVKTGEDLLKQAN